MEKSKEIKLRTDKKNFFFEERDKSFDSFKLKISLKTCFLGLGFGFGFGSKFQIQNPIPRGPSAMYHQDLVEKLNSIQVKLNSNESNDLNREGFGLKTSKNLLWGFWPKLVKETPISQNWEIGSKTWQPAGFSRAKLCTYAKYMEAKLPYTWLSTLSVRSSS